MTNGSEFLSSANVIFTGVTAPYAIDESSRYITPNNAGTNPSPSNIFANTVSGILNSAYLKQTINSATSISLSFNPATLVPAVGGVPILSAKHSSLVLNRAQPIHLLLPGLLGWRHHCNI